MRTFERIPWRKAIYHHKCTPRAAEAAIYGDDASFVYLVKRGAPMVQCDAWYVALADEAEGLTLKEAERESLWFKRLDCYDFSDGRFLRKRELPGH